MYATLGSYSSCPCSHSHEEHDVVREGFTNNFTKIDTPESRRKRRGGKGVDGCKPYDASQPYRYMFDPRYNRYPYDPNYTVVDGQDDGKQYLNVVYSYPSSGSSTRVLYCDQAPEMWRFCDDEA